MFLSVGSIFVYLSIQGSCAFISAISALFVPSTQASWGDLPYIFPLKADSVRALWSTHWHDLFRIMFLDLAFKPTASLARRLGLPRKAQKALGVLAVFTLSGLMHEAGIEGMSWGHADQGWGAGVEGWSYATTKFFVLQGVGVILEDVLQETTGMKVQGWAGRIWAFTWVMGTGWPMIDVSVTCSALDPLSFPFRCAPRADQRHASLSHAGLAETRHHSRLSDELAALQASGQRRAQCSGDVAYVVELLPLPLFSRFSQCF